MTDLFVYDRPLLPFLLSIIRWFSITSGYGELHRSYSNTSSHSSIMFSNGKVTECFPGNVPWSFLHKICINCFFSFSVRENMADQSTLFRGASRIRNVRS